MKGRKLTPKEQREKRVIQAFRSIQKLQKFYAEDILITAFMLGGDKNIHQLSREPKVNMTVSHLSNVTDQWKKEGLITKTKSGRETEIKLTEIGKQVIEIVRKYDEIATVQIDKSKNKEKKEEKNGKTEGKSEVVSSD